MRALGRIGAAVGVLLLLVVGAAWIVPPLLDWGKYRDEIARVATRQLGRNVRIEGPVFLTLLPQPALTASRITVAEGGDGVRLAVKVVRLRVRLLSLFAGRIETQEIALRGLDLRMPGPLHGGGFQIRPPDQLRAQSVSIEEGRVEIGGVVFDDVAATLSAGGITGGFRASGTAALSGRTWRFTAHLSEPGGDGSVAVDATLDGQGAVQGVGLVLSGQLSGDATFGGRIVASGPHLSELLPGPDIAFRAEGRLTVASGLAAADDLLLDLGGVPARGAVAFRLSPLPRLDVAVAAGQIDLDVWASLLARAQAPPMALGLDVSAEAATLAGGTLRKLRAAFDVGEGPITVRELRASLPGEADFQAAGTLVRTAAKNGLRFDGAVHLAAPTITPTVNWLCGAFGIGPGAFPEGLARNAELSAHVVAEPTRLAADRVVGTIENRAVSGSIAAAGGLRPSVQAALRFARIDLDRWLPSVAQAQSNFEVAVRTADADIQIHADAATWRGRTMRPFAIDIAFDAGRVQLRHLAFDGDDVKLSAAGSFADGRLSDVRLDADARTARALFALVPGGEKILPGRAAALLQTPLKFGMSASGSLAALGVTATATWGDLHANADIVADTQTRQWGGPLLLRHPGASRLFETLGIRGAPAWLGDGSFALVMTLAATPGVISAKTYDVTAGSLRATGQATLDSTGDTIRVVGEMRAETLPLPMPFFRSPDPMTVDPLPGWDVAMVVQAGAVDLAGAATVHDASATVRVRGGAYSLDDVQGRLAGGVLTGGGRFDAGADPPTFAATAKIDGATVTGPLLDTSLDLVDGVLAGEASVSASGHSPRAMLATLAGNLRAVVHEGALSGFDLAFLKPGSLAAGDPAEATVRHALSAGQTAFDRLSANATIAHGNLLLDALTLETGTATARVEGGVALPSASADLHVVVRPAKAEMPAFGMRLTGPAGNAQRTPELGDIAQWLALRRGPTLNGTAPTLR